MKSCKYEAKQPNEKGYINYSDSENEVWKTLYERQAEIITDRACDEFFHGLDVLEFSQHEIPQLPDVNRRLKKATGWEVAPVAALISFDKFFKLLADRKFPAATFIRVPEELDYLQEPDIFHELYGHCPMLTHQPYADFTQRYGELGISATHEERVFLARLYWFTVEFGLIQTDKGLRIYGGGILSSIGETVYALESEEAQRKPLKILDALRTPYRIDIFQSVYYIIQGYQDLYDIIDADLLSMVHQAQELGLFDPTFPPKDKPDQAKC